MPSRVAAPVGVVPFSNLQEKLAARGKLQGDMAVARDPDVVLVVDEHPVLGCGSGGVGMTGLGICHPGVARFRSAPAGLFIFGRGGPRGFELEDRGAA